MPLTRGIQMHTPSPCGGLLTPALTCARWGVRLQDHVPDRGFFLTGGGGGGQRGRHLLNVPPLAGGRRVAVPYGNSRQNGRKGYRLAAVFGVPLRSIALCVGGLSTGITMSLL